MRKTIYVADELVWGRVKEVAVERGLSVSQLLLGSFEGPVARVSGISDGKEQLDRIEGKLDELLSRRVYSLADGVSVVKDGLSDSEAASGAVMRDYVPVGVVDAPPIPEKPPLPEYPKVGSVEKAKFDPDSAADRIRKKDGLSEEDISMLKSAQARGQARRDAEKKGRNIKKESIERSKKKVESLTGHSGSYSKDSQVGKKSGKKVSKKVKKDKKSDVPPNVSVGMGDIMDAVK